MIKPGINYRGPKTVWTLKSHLYRTCKCHCNILSKYQNAWFDNAMILDLSVLMHFWNHCISRLTMEQDCDKSMMCLVDKCLYSIPLHSAWRVKHDCQSISVILYFSTNVEIIADQFPLAEHVFNYVQIWCNLVIVITHHLSAVDECDR